MHCVSSIIYVRVQIKYAILRTDENRRDGTEESSRSSNGSHQVGEVHSEGAQRSRPESQCGALEGSQEGGSAEKVREEDGNVTASPSLR